MKNKPTSYKKAKTTDQGMGNPLAIASLGLTAFSAKDQVVDFGKKYWPHIFGLLALGVGGYYVYKYINDSNLDIKRDRSKPPSDLTDVEAQNIANTLFSAMNKSGTDENVIYDALNGKTFNDFVKISDAFGRKYYDKLFGAEGNFVLHDKYGLFEWLSFELDSNDMEKLQQIIPSVFKIEKNVRVGGTAYAKTTFSAHKAKQIDGVWHRQEVDQTYNKGEKIGTIKLIIDDPFQEGKQYAIVDKPWNVMWDLFIDVENIEA